MTDRTVNSEKLAAALRLTASAALLLCAATAQAFVPPPATTTQDWYFTGICTLDCDPLDSLATATLTVDGDYVAGEALDLGDIIAFTYSAPSTILTGLLATPIVAKHFGAVTGSLPVDGGASEFSLLFNAIAPMNPAGVLEFITHDDANDTWQIGPPGTYPADAGTTGSWQVPEPATAALLGLGLLGGAGLARRRHAR